MPHPVYADLIPVTQAQNARGTQFVTSVPQLVYNQYNQHIPQLEFAISQYHPLEWANKTFELTGRHMHVQPLALFLSDGSIWIMYFDVEGNITKEYEIIAPGISERNYSFGPVTIDAYQRLHVQHITSPFAAIQTVEKFMDQGLDVGDLPVSKQFVK
jgi:hypothetical protein